MSSLWSSLVLIVLISLRFKRSFKSLSVFYFSGTKASSKIVQVVNWMLWAFRRYTSSSFPLEIPQSLPPSSSMCLMRIRFVIKFKSFIILLKGRYTAKKCYSSGCCCWIRKVVLTADGVWGEIRSKGSSFRQRLFIIIG